MRLAAGNLSACKASSGTSEPLRGRQSSLVGRRATLPTSARSPFDRWTRNGTGIGEEVLPTLPLCMHTPPNRRCRSASAIELRVSPKSHRTRLFYRPVQQLAVPKYHQDSRTWMMECSTVDTGPSWTEVPHRIRAGDVLPEPWESLFGPLRATS